VEQAVIILDAYPLVAILADEPAAEEAGRLIVGETASVPTPNLAEVVDVLGRIYGVASDRVRASIESLEESTDLRIRPVDERAAWSAGTLRARHYHRRDCPVSIPDCLLLAVTEPEDRVATADGHVLAVAEREGIAWIALPDSTGQRHPPA
jgi:predicted nucleic acid-binding protein